MGNDDKHPMKVWLVTGLVINTNGDYADEGEMRATIEGARLPNHAPGVSILHADEITVDWHDEHPLNRTGTDCLAWLGAEPARIGAGRTPRACDERDEARTALAAVREALACEPGDEVEAAKRLQRSADFSQRWWSGRVERVLAWAREDRESRGEVFNIIANGYGMPALRPGDTLDPADFGKGEAGVLRLAALLAEAPVGAQHGLTPLA